MLLAFAINFGQDDMLWNINAVKLSRDRPLVEGRSFGPEWIFLASWHRFAT